LADTSGHRRPQKESSEGGKGVAAQSISPRPLARAREIWVPTFSDKVAVSAPARIASAFARRRQSKRAAGPRPPVASTPNGEKSHPAAWHAALLCTTLARSASAAADDRPSRTAGEADERSGCDTVTSTARGRGPAARIFSETSGWCKGLPFTPFWCSDCHIFFFL
jgi:hypothetical protein